MNAVFSDFERGLVGLHVGVGAAELNVVQDAPIQILDCRQNQIIVQTEHVEREVVCGLLGIARDTQGAADLEDEDRGVERKIIELLSDILRLLVELSSGILDAFQNIKADLNSVFA